MRTNTAIAAAVLLLAGTGAAAAMESPEFSWIPSGYGLVPPNAVIGGFEGKTKVPVCRARYRDGWHPGRLIGKTCRFAWGGREIIRGRYDVLVGPPDIYIWAPASSEKTPLGALVGGVARGGGRQLVCRLEYQKDLQPGKVEDGLCKIGFNGEEVARAQYEVMVPALARAVRRPGGAAMDGLAARAASARLGQAARILETLNGFGQARGRISYYRQIAQVRAMAEDVTGAQSAADLASRLADAVQLVTVVAAGASGGDVKAARINGLSSKIASAALRTAQDLNIDRLSAKRAELRFIAREASLSPDGAKDALDAVRTVMDQVVRYLSEIEHHQRMARRQAAR